MRASESPESQAVTSIAHVDYEITDRPALPVIWLDTHAVSQIAAARAKESPTGDEVALRNLFERLVRLRQANRVLLVESDQLWEIEVRAELVDRCARVLTDIAQGVSTSYVTVQQAQRVIGMRAFLANGTSAAIPWRTAFTDDPFADHSIDGHLLRVDISPTADEIERRKASYRAIAAAWESLRQEHVARHKSQQERLRIQTERERLGAASAVLHTAELALARLNRGEDFTTEEWARVSQLVAAPLAVWKRLGGVGLVDLVDFYYSPYYSALPYVDIESRLSAWRISGGEEIKTGDVMDIHHISALVPYCTHMVLDRSMINAVQNLKLDQQYQTTALRLNQLGAVLNEVEGAFEPGQSSPSR